MSKLIYPGIVENDWRMLITEIDENARFVQYRWYLPPKCQNYVDPIIEEYDRLCEALENVGREAPRLWRFVEMKGLKLYLCPWCDN